MLKAHYDWKSNLDEAGKWYIAKTKAEMTAKEDDRLFLVVGETGTGKSMLTFHLLEEYEPNLDMKYIVQERKDFAKSLKLVKDLYVKQRETPELVKQFLYLWFDEADTDNLEQQARWNKKLFAMYMKLRKLSILHFWCFPSLKLIDRRFVEEKVRGVFFCYDKAKNRPRNYVFFSKKAILQMLDENIRLNIPNLKKARKKYGWWLGYFKDYNGSLRSAYDAKKVSSMSDAVDDFYDEFSGNKPNKARSTQGQEHSFESTGIYTLPVLARATGISDATLRSRVRSLYLANKLPPQVYVNGVVHLTPEQAELVKSAGRRGVKSEQ